MAAKVVGNGISRNVYIEICMNVAVMMLME